MAKKTPLAEKLDEVRDRIAAAAIAAKGEPGEITLVAVTKTAAPEQMREILQLGRLDLGESRVQVLAQRAGQVARVHASPHDPRRRGQADKVNWHMIGHLQRNKVKPILPLVSLIHSVDSLRLAEELDAAGGKDRPQGKLAHAGERQRRADRNRAWRWAPRYTSPSRSLRCPTCNWSD